MWDQASPPSYRMTLLSHSPALRVPHIPMGGKERKGSPASGSKPRTKLSSLPICKCVPAQLKTSYDKICCWIHFCLCSSPVLPASHPIPQVMIVLHILPESLCIHTYTYTHTTLHLLLCACGGQRIICGKQVSLPTMWIPEDWTQTMKVHVKPLYLVSRFTLISAPL